MRTKFLLLALILFVSLAFTLSGDKSEVALLNNIVIQFEGTNGNGNNLWLDNFFIGARYDNDLAVYSINLKDMNYLPPGQSSSIVSPVVTVINAGRLSNAAATITMIDGGSYTSTKSLGSVSSGQTQQVTFDPLTFNSGTTKNLKTFISWSTDQNHLNDTLYQPTTFYTGVTKKVLFEAHTSSTCSPCATYNPFLDAFIQTKWDSVVAIKYHVWWPAIGDPMYALNMPQVRMRTQYNSISAVPTLTVDGVIQQVSGYNNTILQTHLNSRTIYGSPIALTVTDTRLTGDTIKATVNVQVVAPISPNANYKMKVSAVERKITYPSPLQNGESIFYDVFRRMFPTTDGVSFNTAVGSYSYEFKYKRESAWIDSMIYTAVFIQDENNKEVITCAKSRNYYVNEPIKLPSVTEVDRNAFSTELQPYSPNPVTGGSVIENMENTFPPPGWSVINADSNFTFWQYIYSTVNGPLFPGSRSIRINYYSYVENTGTIDILKSKVYNNVNLSDSIMFNWAYANRPGYNDRLVVKVSTDGGTSFPYTIFDKTGSALATAGSLSTGFVPTATQWGTFAISVSSALTSIKTGENGVPVKYELSQNYPNPFNPVTQITFAIPVKGIVILKVYDILGKEISTLFNGEKQSGIHIVQFDASSLSSGIYFYKLDVNGFTDVKRMSLIK